MTAGYQALADEIAKAGGYLDLELDALVSRLGEPLDLRDTYVQYVVGRHMDSVGVTAEFHAGGGVRLTCEVPRSPYGQADPIAPDATQEPDWVVLPKPPPEPVLFPDEPALPPDQPAEPAAAAELTAKQVGSGLYALLIGVATFFPTIGHQLAPGGKVGEKQDAFFTIYFATFPLSLAATFIFLMLLLRWFDSDKERLWAAGIAIVGSAIWGIGFGSSYADLSAISQLHGNVLAVLVQIVGLALGAYVIYYGWALFIAGLLSSLFAALWLKEKVREV